MWAMSFEYSVYNEIRTIFGGGLFKFLKCKYVYLLKNMLLLLSTWVVNTVYITFILFISFLLLLSYCCGTLTSQLCLYK